MHRNDDSLGTGRRSYGGGRSELPPLALPSALSLPPPTHPQPPHVYDRADRLAGKPTLSSCLLLGSSEVLRSLRHYLRAQSLGHHIIDRLEERGVKRKRYTIFLERTREGHRQSGEYWNCFQGNVGETSEKRSGAYNYELFRVHRHHLE